MVPFLAELGVLALAIGTTASLNRLFLGWNFLGSLGVPVVLCWLSSLALRRWRAPMWLSIVVSMLIALFVLTWQFAPGTTAAGLPTAQTLESIRQSMGDSFNSFAAGGTRRGDQRIPRRRRLGALAVRVLRRRRGVPLCQSGPGRRALRGGLRRHRDPRPPAGCQPRSLPSGAAGLRRHPTGPEGLGTALDPVRDGPGRHRGRIRRGRLGRGSRDRAPGRSPPARLHGSGPRSAPWGDPATPGRSSARSWECGPNSVPRATPRCSTSCRRWVPTGG